MDHDEKPTSTFLDDRRHLLHPFSEFPRFLEEGSRIFDSAEGAYVTDEHGRRRLDGVGGLWCVNIGHGREEMVQAIAEQARKLAYYNTFTNMSSAPAATLAAKLAALAPGELDHVFFTTGGSTAVDSAVRIAQYYFAAEGRPEKRKIIARENGYHGSTYLGASITGIRRNHQRFHTLLEGDDPLVRHVSCPNLYRAPDDLSDAAYLDALIAELERTVAAVGAENIACFIAEPIIGAGGVVVAPEGYHARALEVCRRHDILYISDEVVTGFGRLGHMFASAEAFGVTPDLLVCAKGITSGYVPLGATLFSERVFEGIARAKTGPGPFAHGFTYSGHPVACAAALKNIEILEREDLCAHVRALSPRVDAALGALGELDIVGDVRGRGFMRGVEIVKDKAAKTSFDPAAGAGRRIARAAFERGLVMRHVGDTMVLSPPLILAEEQVDEIAAILRAAIEEVQETL